MTQPDGVDRERAARQPEIIRDWAFNAAREIRIAIHGMDGRDPVVSPENPANKKWLDYVSNLDAAIIRKNAESQLASVTRQLEQAQAALSRTLANFKRVLASKPVRDASETIAEAERVLTGYLND